VAHRARFLIAALVPLVGTLGAVAATTTAAEAGPTRTELLVVRDDGVWRVPIEAGPTRRLPGTRGAVAAAWAPSGRELAFERDGVVYAINADGTGTRALLKGSDPSWSPDGRRLAFARDGRIVVARRNGSSARAVTSGPTDARPAWAPNGRLLAFVRDGMVSIVSSSGGPVSALLPGADPNWSRDGRRIAFADAAGVATAAPDGTDVRLVALEAGATSPRFSPDMSEMVVVHSGNIIAYASDGTARTLGVGTRLDVRRVPVRTELLPDLDQRAPRQVAVARIGDRYKLGFESSVDNVGRGPVWLRSTRAGRTMTARQLVRVAGGGLEFHVDAGVLRYTWSSTHTHWHLIHFERYELRRASDFVLVGRDRKSGFCLADHYGIARRVRPARPFFLGNCAQGAPGARTVEQGSSVGYTDRYPPHFHGQNVDLTGIRPGVYVLVHRANPDGWLRERRYGNNAASIRLRLTRAGGVPQVRVLRSCEGSERC
jgi:dipeptidyl aminopeptidase/acylaminoacyl peptidase